MEGEPIDLLVRARALGRERLGLFLQVAEAVACARARLVVHRDLKPANMLVTPRARPACWTSDCQADPRRHGKREALTRAPAGP